MYRFILLVCFVILPALAMAEEVRLYTSVDQPVAAKIIADFEKKTGITVRMLTDTEATKSAGLAERLRAEAANPRADVWWGNEPFHTIQLANEGLLASYQSPAHAELPTSFVDSQHRWAGSAVRIRVIITGEDAAKHIAGYRDLLKPELKARAFIAKPAFGTTGGHVAALYVLLGEENYLKLLRDLKANGVRLLGGNSIVARTVAGSPTSAGFTDNDDAAAANEAGGKTMMIIPDQKDGEIGTLAIPCTVGLVRGARNKAAAEKLVDYLLSAEVEKHLIEQGFAFGSVRAGSDLRLIKVDYANVAAAMPRAINLAIQILEQ